MNATEKTFSVVRSARPVRKEIDTAEAREKRIALYAARFDAGIGIFNGEALDDKDSEDWLRLADGRSEVSEE